jgi:hypothetical protein
MEEPPMRYILAGFTAFSVLLGLAVTSHAGDDALAIIDKAIEAHGMKGKAASILGYRGKNKGTVNVMGMDLDFDQDITLMMPDKFKEEMELSVMGNKIPIKSVFDGKKGGLSVNGSKIEVDDELLNEFKEQAYGISLSQGLFLRDKALKLSLLGEAKVNGKPALGVRVSKDGKKDISFYFDKGTGLVAKVERRVRDFNTKQEMTEERVITEYQEVEGRKIAKKVEVTRDGNPFLKAEVIEVQFLDKIDNKEFAIPE